VLIIALDKAWHGIEILPTTNHLLTPDLRIANIEQAPDPHKNAAILVLQA
jgi:hypothetical protein